MHLAIVDPTGVSQQRQGRIDEWRKRHSPGAYTQSPSGIHSTSRCRVQECESQGNSALARGTRRAPEPVEELGVGEVAASLSLHEAGRGHAHVAGQTRRYEFFASQAGRYVRNSNAISGET